MNYTKNQIAKTIAHWTNVLESMKIKEDEAEAKKSLKDKIKEAVAPIGSAASIAKSVAICAEKLPEIIKLAQDLTVAINRGAEAMEKLVAQRAGK